MSKKKICSLFVILLCVSSLCGCGILSKPFLEAVIGRDHKEETIELPDTDPEPEEEDSADPAPEPETDTEKEGEPVSVYYEEDYPGETAGARKVSVSESDYSVNLVISAASSVKDFKLYRITLSNDEEGKENPGFEGSEVYSAPELTKDEPLLVTLTFYGDLPEYAYSYKEDGKDLYFTISQSGMDGSLETASLDKITILEEDPLYKDMSDYRFHFASGAGGWETSLEIAPDGSFKGLYYDYDMGDTGEGYEEQGTVYWCAFTGKLDTPKELEPNRYEAKILKLDREVEPGQEEIKDGQRKIYTDAYGLEGTDKLIIYAPGMDTKLLPEDYVSWVYWEFYNPETGETDLSEEMSFYGLLNPANGDGFYSECMLENHTVLSTIPDFPGTKNVRDDYDDSDRSYTIIDRCMDDFSIFNSCFYNEEKLDIVKDRDRIVEICLKRVIGDEEAQDLNVYGIEDEDWLEDLVRQWGEPCIYATWDLDSGVSYSARILSFDRFLYIYAVITDEGTQYMNGEAERFLLGGIQTYGISKPEHHKFGMIKSTDSKVDKKILAEVRSRTSTDGKTYYLVSDEIEFVSSSDTEKMEEYGLKEEDMDNDYAIFGEDGKTTDYPVAEYARFYLQDRRLNPNSAYSLIGTLNDGPKEMIMILYLNEKGEVVFGYEPYLP
ncbi:MAG: hypothetical protein K6F53_11665 [Lachnospiraceae bacterium]|nr:hypothetical protein [Lachnospiraceae bacterium]